MHYPQTSKLSQSFQIRYIFTQFYPLIFPKSQNFQPKSICSLIAESDGTCSLPLFTYPWGTFRIGASHHKDALTSRFCGPSKDSLIKSEFGSLVSLYKSLRIKGYQPWSYGNGFIAGTFMLSIDGERRFVVLQGNHRIAVLAHMGVQRLPVRMEPGYLNIIREAELQRWSRVVDDSCSPWIAQRIFNLFFYQDGHHVREVVENPRRQEKLDRVSLL